MVYTRQERLSLLFYIDERTIIEENVTDKQPVGRSSYEKKYKIDCP